MVEIPFSVNVSSFMEQLTLDNTVFIFIFNWNWRGQFWTMTILDRESVPLAYGIKLVTGIDLLRQYRSSELPQGSMFVSKAGDEWGRIVDGDMGNTASLIYVTKAERETI